MSDEVRTLLLLTIAANAKTHTEKARVPPELAVKALTIILRFEKKTRHHKCHDAAIAKTSTS